MIEIKDVVTLKVPHPDITSVLAERPHMYICCKIPDSSCELVKCQTFKAYHRASGSKPYRRIIKNPDVTRNPFRATTLIDLDKLFIATRALLPESLKTAQGICDELHKEILSNLNETTLRVVLADDELRLINPAM